MLFEKVTKQHVLEGIQDFKSKGIPNGYGPSSTYDLIYNDEPYPPKAIMAYANFRAEGREIEPYFKGGIGTDCFKTYEKLGFKIVKKEIFMNKFDLTSEEVEKCKNVGIGQLVRATLPYILDNELISENSINELEALDYCKENFRAIGYAILKEIDETKSLLENRTINGYSRYYSKPSKFLDKKYLITSEWYEQSFDGYIRFLKSKVNFDSKLKSIIDNLIRANMTNYWVFQGNPKTFDFETALRDDTLDNFAISAHRKRIKFGDKIIVWVTGSNSGCYALGEIIEEPKSVEISSDDHHWKIEQTISIKAGIKITHNFIDNPILKKDIVTIDELKNLKAGNQGSNFSATKEEYYTILKLSENDVDHRNRNSNLNKKLKMNSTNQILYGPPGTGKTYNTINEAIKIGNPSFDLNTGREQINAEFKRLSTEGQIVFTTFHQSMSYEEFIEGIKPVTENGKVIYEIQDGIFKELCARAKGVSGIKNNIGEHDFDNLSYFKMSLGGKNRKNVHDWCLDNNMIALGWGGNKDYSELVGVEDWNKFRDFYKSNYPELVEESKFHIQAVYCFINWMKKGDVVLVSLGNNVIDAIGIIEDDYQFVENPEYPYHHQRKVKWLSVNMDSSPKLFVDKNISQQAIYKFDSDDIKIDSFKKQFANHNSSEEKNFVMIIDEINRGNVSSIFGELITLIELDKRSGMENEISLTLPYSKESFSVPRNVSIIGTMNTADRSVEALDTALRRRFTFKEMMPKYDLINTKEIEGVKLGNLLKTINDRIEILIDRDHTIGHSYFINVNSLLDLTSAFNDKIVPLLQEYFYGDYGKIGLVLGEGFVQEVKTKDIVFAKFKYEDSEDFKTPKHELVKVTSENIVMAIKTLFGSTEQ